VLLELGDLEGKKPEIEKESGLESDSLDVKVAHARLRISKDDAEGVVEQCKCSRLSLSETTCC
jgi:Fe2+ transport system protein FeoA